MDFNATEAAPAALDTGLARSISTKILTFWSETSYFQLLFFGIVAALTYDQLLYQMMKGSIAGPKLKIWPIIGPFLESLDPKFHEYKAKWDQGLSCVSIFHKFVVLAPEVDLTRKILTSPKYLKPCLVDVAVKILRPENWVFLDGKAHVDYRRALNGLFVPKALEVYIPTLEDCIDKYLDKFVKLDGPREFFPEFREFLCALSLKTFCGEFITDEQIANIADDYYKITSALELVNFPIIIPYTKTWYGKKIAHETMCLFEECAGMAKKKINEENGQPNSIMEEWIFLMKEAREKQEADPEFKGLIRQFSNKEISEAIFTFLFASQDASSSLACWLFQVMADRPDIVEKIREEQLRVRNGDINRRLDLKLTEEMTYTSNVVKETLRYRPPVVMVPYLAKQPFPITDKYTAPKGSMVIPTFYPALHDPEVYSDPDAFIPERWENPTSDMEKRNWLVFGSGPHACIGQRYVMMLFTGLLGKALMHADLIHHVTPLSEEIKVFATIFPKDDLILEWKKRDPTKVN